MQVPPNCEGEAAGYLRIACIKIRILQRAACEHGFLRAIKSYRAKLLPVAHEMLLDYNVVDGKFSLVLR
jgi:hypothetical protein